MSHPFLSIPGWLTEPEGFTLLELARAPGEGEVVEVGSYKGCSTAFLAQGLKERGSGVVHAVDHFGGSSEMHPGGGNPQPEFGFKGHSTLEDFERYMRHFELWGSIEVHVGLSVDVAARWVRPVRLLFLDGEHTFEGVSSDYAAWSRFVPPGGRVCFHDYTNGGFPDVRRFVDEVARPVEKKLVDSMLVCTVR